MSPRQSSPMRQDIEVLRQFFASINRNDMDAVAALLDADVTRTEPDGFQTSGTYTGADQVAECVRRGRGTWAEGSCDPEEFIVGAGKVVVYLHARVRLASNNEWVGGRFADGFVVREGKIIEHHTFWEREDALAWAGIPGGRS